jgi:CheY-like chemotaxis protein
MSGSAPGVKLALLIRRRTRAGIMVRLKILVAEDDLGDVMVLRRAFAKAGVRAPIHFARDGQEVLDYLQGNAPFQDPICHPLPNLLLLDLKLPRLDGFEVLRWLREQPGLRRTLVVVLSASKQMEDVNRAYALGANFYVVKPQDPDELVRVVKRLEAYWLKINISSEHISASQSLVEL